MRLHGDHNLETSWRALVVWRYWLYLRRIVKHRADQYWRVVTAHRSEAIEEAKKRKYTKGKGTWWRVRGLGSVQGTQILGRS